MHHYDHFVIFFGYDVVVVSVMPSRFCPAKWVKIMYSFVITTSFSWPWSARDILYVNSRKIHISWAEALSLDAIVKKSPRAQKSRVKNEWQPIAQRPYYEAMNKVKTIGSFSLTTSAIRTCTLLHSGVQFLWTIVISVYSRSTLDLSLTLHLTTLPAGGVRGKMQIIYQTD